MAAAPQDEEEGQMHIKQQQVGRSAPVHGDMKRVVCIRCVMGGGSNQQSDGCMLCMLPTARQGAWWGAALVTHPRVHQDVDVDCS
jgi:hypothetical protein